MRRSDSVETQTEVAGQKMRERERERKKEKREREREKQTQLTQTHPLSSPANLGGSFPQQDKSPGSGAEGLKATQSPDLSAIAPMPWVSRCPCHLGKQSWMHVLVFIGPIAFSMQIQIQVRNFGRDININISSLPSSWDV